MAKSGGRAPGKINASLNAKLATVEWGEYRLGDLFEIRTSKGLDEGKFELLPNWRDETFEFVGRTKINNGIKGYLHKSAGSANDSGVFSVSQVGTIVCQIRLSPWYSSQNIFILGPIDARLLNHFVCASINSMLEKKYSPGYSNYPRLMTLNTDRIKLPEKNGAIDFDFIEEFVAELEATRLAELEAYLEATGLRDYTLTPPEIEALNKFDALNWQSLNVTDVFTVRNTKNILSRDVVPDSGVVPYLGAGANNNSVISYIDYDASYLETGNCVFIGGKTFVVTYQPKDFYSNDSHNLALYVNAFEATRNNQLFMATCLRAGLEHKYSWGDSISSKKIKSDTLALPIHSQTGQIDADYMARLVTAVAKLVIKDVVDFADRRIAATEQVIAS